MRCIRLLGKNIFLSIFSTFALFFFTTYYGWGTTVLDTNSNHTLVQAYAGREISIIINEDGYYYPSAVKLNANERTVVWIANLRKETSCFFVPDKNVMITLYPGKLNSVELTFDKEGIYRFLCPGNKSLQEGRFLVNNKKTNRFPSSISSGSSPLSSASASIPSIAGAASIGGRSGQWIKKESNFKEILYQSSAVPWIPREHNLHEDFLGERE